MPIHTLILVFLLVGNSLDEGGLCSGHLGKLILYLVWWWFCGVVEWWFCGGVERWFCGGMVVLWWRVE